MPNTTVQFRRGTAAEHDTTNGGFPGAEGEVTVDTTNNTLRVHDGTTVGGVRLAKHSELGTTLADGSVTPAKTDFDQLTIEADSNSEGQSGVAALEIAGISGAFIDLRQDPETDYDARLINQTQQTKLISKDPVLIETGTSQNTALNIHTDGKVQVGSSNTPAYALDVTGDVNVTGNFKVNGTNISSGVSKYSTSYFNILGGVNVANNAVLTITHNLNTQAVQVYVYVNSVNSSTGARSVSPEDFEVLHVASGSNSFNLRLADGYSVLSTSNGSRSSSNSYSGKYISVVVIG